MQVATSQPDGEVTDEELAEELELEINTVRRTLIILNENDLADYRRVRDEESGWLTYLWTFHYDRIPQQLGEELQALRDALETRLDYEEQNQFYLCEDCRRRYTFDQAMDFQFVCAECDGEMDAMDSDALEQAIRTRLHAIEEELQNTDL